MSVCPGATNSAQNEAYFYTKQEINEGVFFALSTLANFSTTTLLANLTVSSIVCNPSGSINGAGLMSTNTLLANSASISSLTAPVATVAGGTFAVGGPANYTVIAPSNGGLRIAQSNLALGAMNLTQSTIGFQQTGTGQQSILAACNINATSSPFPGIALTNVSSINGSNVSAFANASTFTTASISSATISSINGQPVGGAATSTFQTASISSATVSSINGAIVPAYQIVTNPGVSVNVPLAVGSTINLASYFTAPFPLVAGRLYDVDIEGQWNFSGAPNPSDYGWYTVRGTLSPYWLASTQPQGSSFQNQTFVYRTIVQGNGSPLTPTLNASFSTFGVVTFTLNRVVVGTVG